MSFRPVLFVNGVGVSFFRSVIRKYLSFRRFCVLHRCCVCIVYLVLLRVFGESESKKIKYENGR